ncbi:metallophosphoesterase [Filobacillus milosensis]|uniref:Metallophosphoesterase n=1 Tax=Filobacillus milosensis TaxID=94137 RepID=A0A4Y8IQD7_9BACI|nr:metallophosphoesterase family protein [Filobacillus milosensis]TFB22886.1 metallophosphoesterase [Filobacillus milosensis]
MRIAIIADVHGNASALEAALSEIDEKNINHIYCLGDMIGIGPQTNEVLHILFSRKNLTMITGNHDESVLAIINGEEHPNNHPHVKQHHEWIAERMDPSFVSKLEQLPRYLNENLVGHHFNFIHYHINDEELETPISENPFHRIVEPSLKNMEELFDGYEAELIGFGHHHPTHLFTNPHTIYLNPGALGCHNQPAARYAIVDVSNDSLNVKLMETPYDNSYFLKSYEKLDVPQRDFIIQAFHGGQMP